MGDKTQLLSFVLAARYRRPWAICAGILAATTVNHALAGALGALLMHWLGPDAMRWILGLGFLAMAVWMLIPDRLDDAEARPARDWGVFGTTTLLFFIAEMGDKTQVATVALSAQYGAFVAVVAGTTLGMMLANVPAVLVGQRLADRMPVKAVHRAAAAIFAVLGTVTLLGGLDRFLG